MQPLQPDWWRAYPGLTWRWRGMDPSGFDCWGLVVHVLRHDFGRPVNDFGALYPDDADDLTSRAAAVDGVVAGWCETEWEEGATVLFNIGGEPLHCGIAMRRPGLVLHAHRRTGVDLLDLDHNPKWRRRLAGLYLPS